MTTITTELESLDAVRAEVETATAMAEAVQEAVTVARTWAAGLEDRWSGAGWGTRDLDQAVTAIGEAAAVLVDGEDLVAALIEARAAVTAAEGLADVVSQAHARGDVAAFQQA